MVNILLCIVIELLFVLIPVLKWTGRRNKILQSFGRAHNVFDSPKVILVGRVMIQRTPRKCIMVVNLERLTIDKFKVLSFIDTQEINCVSYGPFDNGHILLGLSDGWLLAYEYPSLERIESKQIFWEGSEDEPSQLNSSELGGGNIDNEEQKSN